MKWNVYLSGEIHTNWRQKIIDGAQALDLPVTFTSAVTDHQASDSAGDVLGGETNNFCVITNQQRSIKSARKLLSKKVT
jgi:YtoQ family protein